MLVRWLRGINIALCVVIATLILSGFGLFFAQASPEIPNIPPSQQATLPKNSFKLPEDSYRSIDSSALGLSFSPLNAQLPDLRRHLVYYGKNSRPDANDEKQPLYFAFNGNKTPTPIIPGDRLYILYDKHLNPPQYLFSPENKRTSLWIEAEPRGAQATVKVSMVDDEGDIIHNPKAYAEFALPEKEYVKNGNTNWEIGKWRVDATLLARQKTRWYGIDKFIEDHGGAEYKNWMNRQRIDFGEGDDIYSVYVGNGDCMIWKDNRWIVSQPSTETLSYPMLCVKRIDDRVMNLELWDVGGKGKVVLNLVKSSEQWVPKNIEDNFRFIGARTRSQYIFDVENARTFLSPHDWLVLTEDGWKKLITPQEIDDYVNRKVTGPLFVFEGVGKHDGEQVISGTLYSAARTEMVPVELQLQSSSGGSPSTMAKKSHDQKSNKVKETNSHSMVKMRERSKHHQSVPVVPDENDDDSDHYDDGDDD